ncbi:MAG: type II toxin-antitoxin system RelE/ParE family toxin [Elusimicrobiota bacterium]|nr:type II toxin-antitoxin system RelE/ParE family toxin [Elusimicrobiota bacterium]
MQVEKTEIFKKWFRKLDMYIQVILLKHINKLSNGNTSNCSPVGNGVHELKIDFQKGYRIYFTNINGELVLLLLGGHKDTQEKDIQKAKEIKNNL